MPIKIPDDLPASRVLEEEGVMVMRETDAVRQDIRPLRIGLLNLMPNKIKTETQLARLIGSTPLQVELTLVRLTDHVSRHTSADHMAAFYRPWDEVRAERFDGFIITGAPVERLAYAEVTYWDELCRILDWSQTHVHRSFNICWAAQAALFHHYGIEKYELPEKASGVFPHQNLAPNSPFMKGFSDDIAIPVSRWTELRREDILRAGGLEILAESEVTGPCLVHDPRHHALHMFNHLEYDTKTLADEYFRDSQAPGGAKLPFNYFPGDDPARKPANVWRSHGHLLFGNWVNEMYQTTPYDIDEIGRA
ncbi:homoserine O-succinyltransferase [Zavarzinia compransoris]|uniref:Homoserine O-acetyltransferase n=1 Tax=Zavarzinia compransoris TaxID=1264899 RepID=A0A317E4Z3_9PROT|nr:homoserine O-succinyltransferase [Zavarzinia compransoris]PWR22059.1 homoserine O-succinyltransferase [Zavarzinia compransoris]TDP47199.1 homoserine O-succinyltransferase [Zavarzinia compransoris]